MPGAVVATHLGGRSRVWCYGRARSAPDEPVSTATGRARSAPDEPVSTATLFPVGSVTKSLVATALAGEVSAGRMGWDEPLVRYVPEFGFPDPLARCRVTLRDCLAMRLGLKRQGFGEWGAHPALPLTELLRRLAGAEVEHPLRGGFSYTNLGPSAVALAIARATGLRFVDVLRRRVLPVTGAGGVSGGAAAAAATPCADQHVLVGGRPVRLEPWQADNNFGGTGAHLSGAAAAEYLADHLAPQARGLADALRVTYRRHVAVPGDRSELGAGPGGNRGLGYALGWFRARFRGLTVLRHGGVEPGASAHAVLVPAAAAGLLVMTNLRSPAADAAAALIFDALLGVRSGGCAPRPAAVPEPRRGISFRTRPGAPAAGACPGRYHSATNGWARIVRRGGRLRALFRDAPRFSGALVSRGAGQYLLVPDDAAFRPLSAPLRFSRDANRFELDGYGSWVRDNGPAPAAPGDLQTGSGCSRNRR